MSTDHDVAVIGAGFAGLGMAARLKQEGGRSFVVLEKADAIGGTWRENTYPGAACDVQSHLYWYSFGEQPEWTRVYAPQAEILGHLERFVEQQGLADHLRLGTEVVSAEWSDTDGVWVLQTAAGEQVRARALVTAWGQLNRPSYAGIPGREQFTGTSVHSATWSPDLDLAGKRVAVVGTGASAVQIVPVAAEQAAHLTVFQSSPAYVLPRADRAYEELELEELRDPEKRRALREAFYAERESWVESFDVDDHPIRQAFVDLCRAHLENSVADPVLREKLWPDFELGCKRTLVTDDYYPTLVRDDVDLVDERVVGVEPTGLRTADGALHEVDVVVYATGFETLSFLGATDVRGRSGRSLRETWERGAHAYLGMTVSGFPNLFMLYGPNTNLGHSSVLLMIEAQVEYVLQALDALRAHDAAALDVRADVLTAYDAEQQAALQRTALASSCTSWYKGDDGRIVNNWHAGVEQYRARTRELVLDDYELLSPA